MNWTPDEFGKVLEGLYKKVATDKIFRMLALKNPYQAIKEISGEDFPIEYKIKFIENEPGVDLTVVLPTLQTGELSDADLDQVAGGIVLQPLTVPTIPLL